MLSFTKFVFLIFISLFAVTFVNAQDVSVVVSKDINMPGQDNVLFGQDVLIADSEPEGPISGVKATDGTVWVAINDTTISAGRGLVFYKSTNNGTNWTQHGTFIQPAFKADQVKMFKAGDSTYCFFRIGGTVYRFNVGNSSFGTFTPAANITQFDVVASSTNSLYIYYANATQIIRYGSIDGGFTWANNGNVTTNVSPVLGISATGDTLTVMYRASAGGETSQITRFRYRETAPGVLASAGPSIVVLAAGPTRTQYYPYRYSGVEWIVYTEGTTPNIELKCVVSVNGGLTYGSPVTISTGAGIDNFWFAGGMSLTGSFIGLDVFYYRDSVIAGPPTIASDKLKYAYASVTNSSAFGYLVPGVSENPPVSNSTANYKPCAIELGNADVGVIFVGETSGSRKVYFDRLSSITNITNNNIVADNYSLSQNYPNPFNPSTTIKFSIPKSEYVSLKVYDIMGKEIATLVNSQMNMGSYNVDFNAKNLSSGVYFYKLISGDFTEVKRMTLVK